MKEEVETSKFSMTDYYKVLKYLPKSRVDRQEPCNISSLVVDGTSVVLPTIHYDFNGTDDIQLFVNCHGADIDVSKVSLNFSPLINGNASIVSLNATNENLSVDDDDVILFSIDQNYTATDVSRKLTGIESIKIDFNGDASGVEIQKLIIRSKDYVYTLDDINTACENGQAYVLRRLNNMRNEKKEIKQIPKILQQYVYMAAGAYAWLTRWEYEAKPMKEPKSESNNYADRLFTQVDDAITKYLSNIENNRNEEYLNLHHVTTAGIRWGIR